MTTCSQRKGGCGVEDEEEKSAAQGWLLLQESGKETLHLSGMRKVSKNTLERDKRILISLFSLYLFSDFQSLQEAPG